MWLDPVVSIVLALIVLASTWSLLRRAMNLALDAVPEGVEIEEVRAFLLALPNAIEVHDLHVWAMSTTETLLTSHVVVSAQPDDRFLAHVCDELHTRFAIGHSTVQIEVASGEHCRVAAEGMV